MWVHTEDVDQSTGTAERCMELLDGLKAPPVGWCVGDDATLPVAEAFQDSVLANPGYDLVVDRHTMRIEVASTHGAGPRNENLTAEELFSEIRRVVRTVAGPPE